MELLTKVLVGVGSGITVALTGYAKSKGEEPDYVKAGATIVVGALVGLVNGLLGVPVNYGLDYAGNMGATVVVENLIKAVWRRVFS